MRKLYRLALCLTALLVVGVGLLLLRNYQMDAGGRAIKEGNGVVALEKLKPLAYFGDKTAQLLMGEIYALGLGGVTKNDTEAIYWFRRCGPIVASADEKDADPAASHELSVAKAYASGNQGVKADPVESAKWLRLAAEGGSKEAAMIAKSQLH